MIQDLCQVLEVEPTTVMAPFTTLEEQTDAQVDPLTGSTPVELEPVELKQVELMPGFAGVDTWVDALEPGQDRAFLEAAMGASALMAWADQDISLNETAARDFCLSTIHRLQAFDPEVATAVFNQYVEALHHTPQQAKTQILDAVAAFAGDEQARMLIISIGVAIGKSDYEFSAAEQGVIHELCDVLGMRSVEALNSLRTPEPQVDLNRDPLTGIGFGLSGRQRHKQLNNVTVSVR